MKTAVCLGADAIGLVFHPASSRFIDLELGRELRHVIPPFVTVVALLLDENVDYIADVIEQVKPDCLQFHGRESADFCEQFAMPYIKSIPMGSDINPIEYASAYTAASGFLLDSNAIGKVGGSGDSFDWSRIPQAFDSPLILAGGLSSSNVGKAILQTRPWAVDVSSGVESGKGIKDAEKMASFFREAKRADESL